MKDSVVLPAPSKVFILEKKKSLPSHSFVYLSCSFHTNQCCYTTGSLKAPSSCQQPPAATIATTYTFSNQFPTALHNREIQSKD